MGGDGTNFGSVDAENQLSQKNEVLQNHEIRFRDFLQHLIRLVGVTELFLHLIGVIVP